MTTNLELALYKNWNPATEYKDMLFVNKINNPLFINTYRALDKLKSIIGFKEKDINQYFINIISESITSLFHYMFKNKDNEYSTIDIGHLYLRLDNIEMDKKVYKYIHLILYLAITMDAKLKSENNESISEYLECVNRVYNSIMLQLYKDYMPDQIKVINFYRSQINDSIEIDENFMPWKPGSNEWHNEEGESMHH